MCFRASHAGRAVPDCGHGGVRLSTRVLGTDSKEAWQAAFHVNAVSTLVGIPITWAFLAFTQATNGGGTSWPLRTPLDRVAAVTLQAPWLIPREKGLGWMIPAASLALLIPFYVASVFVENWLLERRWKRAYGEGRRFGAVALANLASYTLLACFYGVMLCIGIMYREAESPRPKQRGCSPVPTATACVREVANGRGGGLATSPVFDGADGPWCRLA